MTEFKPNPLFQHGVVTTNGDGLSIDDVSSLFQEHRDAVAAAQGEATNAKAEAQRARDAAEAAARFADQARQEAETLAAQAAVLESQVQVAEVEVASEPAPDFSEAIANTEKIIEETYGITLNKEETEEVFVVDDKTGEGQLVEKPKRAPRARKVADPTE